MLRPKQFVAVAAVILCVVIGCGQDVQVVKFGANLPLTGTVAYYGTSSQKGIELAIDELKKEEQFKNAQVRIIYEDNQGQARMANTAMSKLANVDKVPAVIGCGTSTETMAAAPIANETKTVLISPVSSATSIADAGPFVFRTCPSDLVQAQDLASWILESGFKSVGVIYANSTWGTGFKDNFVNHFSSNGGSIVDIKSSDPGDTNFRTQLSVLKSTKPDAFVFIIYAKEGSALVRQARELGLTTPIFGADPWSQRDFRMGAGSFAEDVRYTTPAQFDGETFKAFRNAFLNKYKEEPDVYASNGYDCMMLLAKAYSNGARTGDEFQQYLGKVDNFLGATGITKFDANGDVVGKRFGRFVIRNGEPVSIK